MKKLFVLLTLFVSLLVTSCYSWYEEKIDMDTKTPKINLGDLFYKEAEISSLEAPKQLIISKGIYSGTVKLHWDEVPYATSYRIERAEMEPDIDGKTYQLPDEGDFEVINKYVYSNNYSDLILASPSDSNKEYTRHYYYRVSAENIMMGFESSEFTQVTAENSGWLLAPPAVINAAKGENPEYIEVSWSPVSMATKYLIFRSEKSNGLGMEQLDSVTGNVTSYKNYLSQNEKGVEFYYKVCAVLDNGSQSAFTGLAMGYSAKEGAPTAPTGLQITNGKAESLDVFKLTWTAFDSANKITYNLYRTSSEDSIYTLIASNISGKEFTDTSVKKPGVKYYYYAQTIEEKTSTGEKLKSPFTKTGPDAPIAEQACGWLLSPPDNCEIVELADTTQITLRWTPSVGYEEIDYSYNIYASDTLDGDFELLSANISKALDSDGYFSYQILRKPFYKIRTLNIVEGETKQSAFSQAVAPSPQAPVNVVATKTDSLGGISNYTANTNGVYPVKISWKAPAGETPYGYYIYRSTKPDSSFRKITDSPVTGGTLYFIDENETARPGTMYYYKVVSLNILMQGKNSNAQTPDSRGYGALTRDQWFREYNKTVKKSQSKLTLMHKAGTGALGSEDVTGDISGTLEYVAKMDGLGARITMHYTNYAEFYVNNDKNLGVLFLLNGDTNTSANMSANGNMDGTNTAHKSGMYPGYAKYDNLEIKGGGAGGGYYVVCVQDKNGNTVLPEGNVSWTVGEE